jgi:hypothetical protein
MVLVDSGRIANPAIRILVRPPSDAFPASAVISGTEPRVYRLPAGDGNRSWERSFPTTPVPVRISIFSGSRCDAGSPRIRRLYRQRRQRTDAGGAFIDQDHRRCRRRLP